MNRLTSLAKAESLQFFRNPLLMTMMPFPIAMALLMAFTVGDRLGLILAGAMYVLFSLGFVVYYSALSMATTRRDEKVLKRLRTGEARDWEILASIAVPLSALTFALAPVTVGLLLVFTGAPLPSKPHYMLAALLLGIPVAHGLALLTSRFTRNAEAAMITSFPVLVATMLSFPGGIRELLTMLPGPFAQIVSWNPLALAADLFLEGWIGDSVQNPLLAFGALAAWAAVTIWAGIRWMRWDTHR